SSLFSRRVCFASAHGTGETLFISGDRRQLRTIPFWWACLLFLVVAQDDSLFLPRHTVAWLGADLDGTTVLFVRDTIHHRFRVGFRIAGSRPGAGSIWINHLQIYGAHPAVRRRPDFCPGHHHHADAR